APSLAVRGALQPPPLLRAAAPRERHPRGDVAPQPRSGAGASHRVARAARLLIGDGRPAATPGRRPRAATTAASRLRRVPRLRPAASRLRTTWLRTTWLRTARLRAAGVRHPASWL